MTRKIKLHPLIKKLTISYTFIALCMWISFEISIPLVTKGFLTLTKNPKWSGLPLTIYGIMGACFSILFGRWADRYGRRKAILMALGVLAVGMSLTGFSYSHNCWIGFIIGAAIIGIGTGGNELPNTSAGDIYPAEHKGKGIGIVSSGWWLGMVIGPGIGGYLADTEIGFAGAYYTGAILGFIGMIILLLVRYEPLKIAENLSQYYPHLKQKKEKLENPVFSTENKVNGSSEDIRSTWQLFRLYPMQVQFWTTVLCQGGRVIFVISLPIVLTVRGLSMFDVGIMIMAMGVATVIFAIPVSLMADKYGRRPLLIYAAVSILVSLLLASFTLDKVFLILLMLLLGSGYCACMNISQMVAADISRPQERGRAFGIFILGVNIGVIVFPIFTGFLLSSKYGYRGVSTAGSLLMVIGIILALALKETSPGIYKH